MTLEAALLAFLTVWVTPSGEPVYAKHCGPPHKCEDYVRRFVEDVRYASAWHDVNPWTLAAIAVRETGLNPNRVGRIGERGEFQLNPRNRANRDALRYHRREQALRAAQLLSEYTEWCGSETLGLGAYNTGKCVRTRYARRVLQWRSKMSGAMPRSSTANAS